MDHATAECYVMERRRWELCIFGCCGPLHVQYCCSDPKEVTITLIASLVGGALFISILMIILSCCFKRRDKNDGSGGNDSQSQPCESAAQQCTQDISDQVSSTQLTSRDETPPLPVAQISLALNDRGLQYDPASGPFFNPPPPYKP